MADQEHKHSDCSLVYVVQNMEKRLSKLEESEQIIGTMRTEIELIKSEVTSIKGSITNINKYAESLTKELGDNKKWLVGVVVTIVLAVVSGWITIFTLMDKKFTDITTMVHKIDTAQQIQIQLFKDNGVGNGR